jgi:hypothetical protein
LQQCGLDCVKEGAKLGWTSEIEAVMEKESTD